MNTVLASGRLREFHTFLGASVGNSVIVNDLIYCDLCFSDPIVCRGGSPVRCIEKYQLDRPEKVPYSNLR